jgi:hypothetical protein
MAVLSHGTSPITGITRLLPVIFVCAMPVAGQGYQQRRDPEEIDE